MSRDATREIARATIDAATSRIATPRYVGGTVVGAQNNQGIVAVNLDADDATTTVYVPNGCGVALAPQSRVVVAMYPPAGALIVAAGSGFPQGGRCLIYASKLTAAAATFAITGIPQCFQHLELVATLRTDNATGQDCLLRVNGLSGGIYTGELVQFLSGGGGVTGGQQLAHTSLDWWCYLPGANQAAGYFGQSICRILNYNQPAIWPTMMGERAFWTADAGLNGTSLFTCTPGPTSAIVTRIDLLLAAGNFLAGSNIELYGVGTAQ